MGRVKKTAGESSKSARKATRPSKKTRQQKNGKKKQLQRAKRRNNDYTVPQGTGADRTEYIARDRDFSLDNLPVEFASLQPKRIRDDHSQHVPRSASHSGLSNWPNEQHIALEELPIPRRFWSSIKGEWLIWYRLLGADMDDLRQRCVPKTANKPHQGFRNGLSMRMARVRDRMLIMAQADNADAEPPDKKKDVINGLYWIDPHNFDELLLRGVSWKLSGPPEARKMKRRTVDELEMGNLLRLDNYDGTEYDAPELHDLSEFMQKIVQEAGFTVPTVEGFNNGQVFNDLDKKVYFSKESRRHKYNGRKPGARGPSKSSANEAEDDEDSFDSEDLNDDPESDADSDVEAVPSRHRKRSPNEERREPPGWWEYFAELTKWPAAMIARINPNSCLMTIGHPFAYCEHCHFHHPPSRYSQCWMLLEQLEKPDLIPLADGSEEIDDEAPPKSAVHGEGRNSRKRKAADVSEEDEGTDTRFGKAQKIDEEEWTPRYVTKYPREWPGEDDHDDEAPPHDRLIAAPTSRQARLEMREAPSVPEVPHQEVGEYAVAAPDCTRRWIRAPMIRTHVDAETRAAYDIQEDYYEAVHLPAEPGFASTYQPEQGYVSWSDWWEVPTIPDICKDLLRPTE